MLMILMNGNHVIDPQSMSVFQNELAYNDARN